MRSHDGLKAMVLAAGVGSRLDPLTRQLPKPVVPFANRPVMEHILRLLKRHGITQTVSNVHYLPDRVTNYFENGANFGMDMQFVREQSLSGDAGGVRACRDYLGKERFLVVMGDLITDMDLSYVINQHIEKGAFATIALKQVVDVERFGVAVLNKDGLITGFQEKPSRDAAKSNLASTGIYVFEPEIFEYIGDAAEVGFGKMVFPKLVADKLPVLGVEVWGYWSDVGTVDQYMASTIDALQGLIDMDMPGLPFEKGWMDAGSSIGSQTLIDGVVLMGKDSHISDGVRIRGYAVIGDNCLIEHGADIQDSIIWPGTIIGANSRVARSVVGANVFVEKGSSVTHEAIVEPALSETNRLKLPTLGLAQELSASNGLAEIREPRELDADLY
jgi:NDP-sugar pyrophosphorylase family protein